MKGRVWVFVTVGRKDVEYQSDQNNLRIADFIFQSFAKMCLVVSCQNVRLGASTCLERASPHKKQNVW